MLYTNIKQSMEDLSPEDWPLSKIQVEDYLRNTIPKLVRCFINRALRSSKTLPDQSKAVFAPPSQEQVHSVASKDNEADVLVTDETGSAGRVPLFDLVIEGPVHPPDSQPQAFYNEEVVSSRAFDVMLSDKRCEFMVDQAQVKSNLLSLPPARHIFQAYEYEPQVNRWAETVGYASAIESIPEKLRSYYPISNTIQPVRPYTIDSPVTQQNTDRSGWYQGPSFLQNGFTPLRIPSEVMHKVSLRLSTQALNKYSHIKITDVKQ